MKTLLDLTSEFAALNDAKTCCKRTLPAASEKRWAELKAFYDVLMARAGVHRRSPLRRFTVADIRRKVPARMRLRVPAEMDILVHSQDEYHTAQVLNLSCGGALLTADTLFDLGSRLTLYLIKFGRGSKSFLKTEGEVVWHDEASIFETKPPDKMGIRFIGLAQPDLEELESFVIETLERQLLALDVGALTSDFVYHEKLAL